MAAGCAVISTRVGFVPEIISSGNNGILCQKNSAECFKSSLMDLILNPQKRFEMKNRAADHIKRNRYWGHDRDRIMAAHEAVAKDPPISSGFQILRALLSYLVKIIFHLLGEFVQRLLGTELKERIADGLARIGLNPNRW